MAFPKQSSFGNLGAGAADAGGTPLAAVKGATVPPGVTAIFVSSSKGGGFEYERRVGASVTRVTLDDVRDELAAKAGRGSVLVAYMVVAVAGALGLALVRVAAGAAFAVLAAVCGSLVAAWDRDRRAVRLAYDVSEGELLLRAGLCATLGEALARSKELWVLGPSKPAGGRERVAATVSAAPMPNLETNLAAWSVSAGARQIAFMPDCILERDGVRVSAHPYAQVTAAVSGSASGAPGAPGELALSSPGGLSVELATSDAAAAVRAQALLQRLREVALGGASRPAPAPALSPATATAPVQKPPTPPPAESGPVMGASLSMAPEHDGATLRASMLPFVPSLTENSKSERLSLLTSVMTLLKYVAAADRKIASEEVDVIAKTLRDFASDPHEAELTMRSFKSTKADDADALVATHALRDYSEDYARRVVETAERVAKADGDVTAREGERIEALKVWLSG